MDTGSPLPPTYIALAPTRLLSSPQVPPSPCSSAGNTVGVVEFETADDMEHAIRKLDDTEVKQIGSMSQEERWPEGGWM